MGSAEKFCLRWNDFEANVSTSLSELRHDQDFFDVTLASEDHRQVRAHKVILAACSPFFRRVLKANPHERPLLYLKGVRHTQMVSVLNFMYHGQVNVAQDDLNDFLAAAEELSVKGLTTGKQEATFNASKHSYQQQRPKPRPKEARPVERSSAPAAKKPRPSENASSEDTRLHPQEEGSEEAVNPEEVNIKDEPRVGTSSERMAHEEQGGDGDVGMEGEVTVEDDFEAEDDNFEAYAGYDQGNGDFGAAGGVGLAAEASPGGSTGNKGKIAVSLRPFIEKLINSYKVSSI